MSTCISIWIRVALTFVVISSGCATEDPPIALPRFSWAGDFSVHRPRPEFTIQVDAKGLIGWESYTERFPVEEKTLLPWLCDCARAMEQELLFSRRRELTEDSK